MAKITREDALEYHRLKGKPGKVAIVPTKPMDTQRDLSLAYSPGVAEPVLEIEKNPADAYEYTSKGNLVAVISNGTAILGLGDRGADGRVLHRLEQDVGCLAALHASPQRFSLFQPCLARAGRRVIYATRNPIVSDWTQMTDEQYLVEARLAGLGVEIRLSLTLGAIAGTRATFIGPLGSGETAIEAGRIVLVTGRLPRDELYTELTGLAEAPPVLVRAC